MATEPHQIPGCARRRRRWRGRIPDAEQVRAQVNSAPPTRRPVLRADSCAIVNPVIGVRAGPGLCGSGADYEHACAEGFHAIVLLAQTPGGATGSTVVLATNVFRARCVVTGCTPFPCNDYVLGTQPLTPEQLDSISWQGRQGISDTANQFHSLPAFPPTTASLLERLRRRVLLRSQKVDQNRRIAVVVPRSPRITFPQLSDVRWHRVVGPIDTNTRFCAHQPGRPRRVRLRQRVHWLGASAPRGLPPTSAWTSLPDGQPTERTELEMVHATAAVPTEPLASAGIRPPGGRWTADHRWTAQSAATGPLDGWDWVRL